ncbi:hypothetical protein P3T37_003934 [Kitasatospora sp. MAA4]|uniref:hypothetical protein n=1 Tax=Kitasatospora sp. MAA4 TaxID=3035093 RepID=UPI00247D3DB5|nr:hypothetical protein [Kitasatospora sp. MAA4]
MTDPAVDPLGDAVEQLVGWLDGARTLPEQTERIMRIMKLSEEVGESCATS